MGKRGRFGAYSGIHAIADKVRARLSADQSVEPGTWTKILFDAETFDEGGHFSGSAYTASEAGYYLVTGGAAFASPGIGSVISLDIRKGAAILQRATVTVDAAGATTALSVATLLHLEPSEYVELWTHHSAGAAKNLHGTAELTHMTILGPF